MKQNFQLHYFYGENENAIRTQVWWKDFFPGRVPLRLLACGTPPGKTDLDTYSESVSTRVKIKIFMHNLHK